MISLYSSEAVNNLIIWTIWLLNEISLVPNGCPASAVDFTLSDKNTVKAYIQRSVLQTMIEKQALR